MAEVYHLNAGEKDDTAFPQFVVCSECRAIIHNPNNKENTNKLIRHSCVKSKINPISTKEREEVKKAATKMVAGDLRPYRIVDGVKFKSFCGRIFRLGQNHPNSPMEVFL